MLLQSRHDATVHSALLPHGFCYLWEPGLLWTHFWSDLLIGVSYVTISFSLAWLVHKARRDIPFSLAFVAFGLFIITCGGTHFMDVWTLWTPVYWVSAGVKVVTAAASVATAVWMPFLVPRAQATIADARLARERAVAAARAEVLEAQNTRLAASERQLRTMLDAIPTLAWTATADGFIDWYNARWYEYTGTTPDDMAGWGWQSVHDPAVLPQVLERWRASIASGASFEMTFPLRGADGVFRPFLTRIAPVRDAEGRVTRWFGTNTDLTPEREAAAERERLLAETKAAEAAVEAERTLLREILEQMPMGVAVAEAPSGRLLYLNAAGGRILGHERRPAADAAAYDVYGAEHDDGTPYAPGEYPLVRATGGETVQQQRQRYRRGDGTLVTLSTSAGPVYDAGGRLVRAVAAWSDVSATVALEDALRRARDAAESANRAKSEFLARMSHELRTPLNAIQGHVQLVEMELHGPITAAQREALARVTRAQQHLLSLIGDILDLARLERGAVPFDIRAVELGELLGDVEPIIAPEMAAKQLDFRVDLPASPPTVRADRQKLAQVLLNLLDNAVKFTPPGGTVTVRVPADDGASPMVRVQVTDTGIGIPPDQLEAVFQPFVQIQGAYTREVGGAGLGLAISRDLARGMGGDVTVESALGAGSTFTLTLRRA